MDLRKERTMGIEIIEPDTTTAVVEVAEVVRRAHEIVVKDAATHGEALEFLRQVVKFRKGAEELWKPTKKAADAAHKAACDGERKLTQPADEATRIVKEKVIQYEREERERAAAEQRRLEAEQRKRAEEERAREQEAERRRAEERRLQDAIIAEQAGDTKAAEAMLDAPIEVPRVEPIEPAPVHVAPRMAAVSGVSRSEKWSARVVDLPALVKYAAENAEAMGYLLPNQTVLNALARAQKAAMKIPGVQAVKDDGLSFRSTP